MNKVVLSVVLALGTVVAVVGGVMLGRDSGTSGDSTPLAPAVAGLRGELLAAREEIRAMAESIDGLRLSHERLSNDVRDARTPIGLATASAGDGVEGGAAPGLSVADLQGVVAAVLDEERRVKEEERDRQREESRERLEERRREVAALSEGPFDRYNLKINSLGNVLNMTDAQKQGYFELTTAYREKLEEGMKQLRESRKNDKAEGGGEDGGESEDDRRGRRRGSDGGDREKFRELYSGTEEQFTADVQQLLTAQQFETYGQLSRTARSVFSRDQVRAAEEDGGRSDRGRNDRSRTERSSWQAGGRGRGR